MTSRRRIHRAVRELCAALFAEPERLSDFIRHRVADHFSIQPHVHTDELQLDLLVGCTGHASLGRTTVAVRGLTLLTHYPGDRHGFTVRGGERWHLKLQLGDLAAIRQRVWPESVVDSPPLPNLLRTARELSSYAVHGSDRPPRLVATVTQLLSSWPLRDVSAMDAATVEDARDLAEAVELIQSTQGSPPSIESMAKAAHLSTRHFARRFQARFGCTPADFADRHRLARARSLLLGRQSSSADVADAVGFASRSAFSRWFRRHVGQTPTAFQQDPLSA
ncbi:MAG: AraC family transcriptional regulator [Planctomycetota bacterium]